MQVAMQQLSSRSAGASRGVSRKSTVAAFMPSMNRQFIRSAVPFARSATPAIRRGICRTAAPAVSAFFNFGGATATKTDSGSDLYNFEVKDIDGRPVKLNKYKGQVLLVVNLASACGFTPQYAELQGLQDKFGKQGFSVLGFPCNQFGGQEPGTNAQIKKFAASTYGVKFPLFAKVDVNGGAADPLFDWLKAQKGGILGNDIKWNFSKFLVDKDGNVVKRYGSTTTPGAIEGDIAALL